MNLYSVWTSTLLTKLKIKAMKVTPEIVKELYLRMDNKQLFISVFGTTKFHLVTDDFLLRMYNYLIKKVK